MADLNYQTIAPEQEPQVKRDLKQAQRSPSLPTGQKSLAQEANKMEQTQTKQMAAIKGYRPGEKEYKQQLESRRKKSKQGAAGKGVQAAGKGAQAASQVVSGLGKKITAMCLKNSWLYLIATYGATILYINFHFFGKYIAGSNAFCEFGEEWTSGIPGGEITGTEMATQKIGSAAKWAEIILLFLCDILLVLLIFFIVIITVAPVLLAIGVLGWVESKLGI